MWLRTLDHVPAEFFTSCHPNLPWFASMVFSYDTSPSNRFPTTLQLLNAASTCTLSETLFNNTFLRTHAPFRSFTFLLNVGTESLKTNVRVCFAQPSHSGAECDPRHRGAVFAQEIIHPNLPPTTGYPLEVIDTSIESTDALAAGPKTGLLRQPPGYKTVRCSTPNEAGSPTPPPLSSTPYLFRST